MSTLFQERADQSQQRLAELRVSLISGLGNVQSSFDDPELCIYATGSLARLEATRHSDLDAFFLLSGTQEEKPLSRIKDVKILNVVVDAAEASGFPDFSNDGEFLTFLHVDNIVRHLGDRLDDYHNALTARMLMLLESKYLFNEEAFRRFRKRLVDAYFDDFHDHSKSFRPIFLLNDILRFWRTMCINYENGRQWRTDNAEKSAKGHLANLKLKFSRLLICFSFVAHLLAKNASLTPDDVIHTADLTPIERINALRAESGEAASLVEQALSEYAWFLEETGKAKTEVLTWISQEASRQEAFEHAARFVEIMGHLVRATADKHGYLRYLIV